MAPSREKSEGQPAAPVPRRRRAVQSDREVCPRCGRATARLIGRSESFPVLYLRCDDCAHTSVAPA
ncbi:MAG: hypothetical protein ABI868_22465 [Acidobacteriota bacterium]